MTDRTFVDPKPVKETFYVLGKLGKISANITFFESIGVKGKPTFTTNVDDAWTVGSYERIKELQNQRDSLKKLTIIEVTLKTQRTYTFKKEVT